MLVCLSDDCSSMIYCHLIFVLVFFIEGLGMFMFNLVKNLYYVVASLILFITLFSAALRSGYPLCVGCGAS